jgi:D-alanyl-D-alanine endopeptidase (penicillin-binding protein 7)
LNKRTLILENDDNIYHYLCKKYRNDTDYYIKLYIELNKIQKDNKENYKQQAKQDLDEYIKPYTRRELIQLAMIKSDNKAAEILCNNYVGGRTECVRAMNNKARSLNLVNTKYVEPTGLSIMNISTARELVAIVKKAQEYPEIVEASKTNQIKIKIRKKWIIFNNTNPIIGKRHNFIVSKTGYISASGGCIVMMLDTDIGRRTVVVLGSKNTHTRIPEAEFIATKE